MSKFKIITFSFLLVSSIICQAQELSCKVAINTSALNINTSGDKQIFTDLELAIKSFMNNQRWTSDNFGEKEKVKCSLNINLLASKGQYSYSGNAVFTVFRPVYGTTYETILLKYIDRNFDFSFNPEDRNMIFNENNFSNNLTSMLAYYSLVALTLDYDSFSKMGGSPYLERAFGITNLAGNAIDGAWVAKSDVRSRFHLAGNLRNQQFNPFREGYYNYHRIVLDDLASNPVNARKEVLAYLQEIKLIAIQIPGSLIINTFFDGKGPELVNIFSEGTKAEKQQAFNLISQLDPSNTETYRKILKN